MGVIFSIDFIFRLYNEDMIYLLKHYGFCNGVKNSIDILKKACQENETVSLLHPLMHNDLEVEKLQNEYRFKTGKDSVLSSDAIVFSAHGHTKEEEEQYESHPLYDAICPLLKKRYEILNQKKDLKWYFLGKKNHQETISFLSNFPNLNFIDSDTNEFPELKQEQTGLIVQSTISEEIANEYESYFRNNTSLIAYIPPCPVYLTRKQEAIDFFRFHDSETFDIIVLGSKTSSNCNELKESLKKLYPSCNVLKANTIEDIDVSLLDKENILLVSSTSISEESVECIYDYLVKNHNR